MCLYEKLGWLVFASGRTLIRAHEIYANYWKIGTGPFLVFDSLCQKGTCPIFPAFILSLLSD